MSNDNTNMHVGGFRLDRPSGDWHPSLISRIKPGKHKEFFLADLLSGIDLTSEDDLGFSVVQPEQPVIKIEETIFINASGIKCRQLRIRPVNDGEAVLHFTYPPLGMESHSKSLTSTVKLISGWR